MSEILLTTFSRVLITPHFAGNVIFSVVSTVGMNYLIDKYIKEQQQEPAAEYVIVGQTTPIDFLIFTAIVSLIVYAGTGSIVKRITSSKTPVTSRAPRPLSATVLDESSFARVFMGGQRTALGFVGYCLLLPGLVITCLQTFVCWRSQGYRGDAVCKTRNLEDWLFYTEMTKGIIAAIVFTINYIAAHDERQSEIRAWLSSIEEARVK